jgi:hypothetical protein
MCSLSSIAKFQCFACGESYYGMESEIKNTKKCWIYLNVFNQQQTYAVSCDDQKCFAAISNLLTGCIQCGETKCDINESMKNSTIEDPNIGTVDMLCSRKCRIKNMERYLKDVNTGLIKQRCSICKTEGIDMHICDKCGVKYYCSKDCQLGHELNCDNKLNGQK